MLSIIGSVVNKIQGLAAQGAVALGNPILIGGEVDDTATVAVDEGDARRIRVSTTGEIYVIPIASTINGATPHATENLADTVVAVKSSAGQVYGIQVLNDSGATAYLQVFNVAIGSVTLGTTTPNMQFRVPNGLSLIVPLPSIGVTFDTAISIASTTTATGATGSGANVDAYVQYK